MIRGQVLNREPIIELELSSATNKPKRITAVIDTGYNGYLTLPGNLVSQFNLPFAGYRTATLADGTADRMEVRRAGGFRQRLRMLSPACEK